VQPKSQTALKIPKVSALLRSDSSEKNRKEAFYVTDKERQVLEEYESLGNFVGEPLKTAIKFLCTYSTVRLLVQIAPSLPFNIFNITSESVRKK
jgi:hypothetical protein